MSMKQHLIIKNLGPIKNCEIDLTKMIVLDGPQAAGKSTVAKAIFFFRTVKNDIVEALINPYADPVIKSEIQFRLRDKFIHLFGDNINENTLVSFEYGNSVNVEMNENYPKQINQKILDWAGKFFDTKLTSNEKSLLYREASELFNDDKEIVYIPAGRSMLSILSESLSHIFFNFDDEQKNMIDYCTTDYINRVTKIKPVFRSPEKFVYADNGAEFNPEFLASVREKMWKILQGKYKYLNGEEFLQLFDDDSKKIKIKFASSGQQEVLWILNLIYYYILKQKPTCFIIEEPEAHLYPNSQKEIAEYIALALSEKNDCVLTTHSPYILGTLSNLLDTRRMMDEGYNISKLLEKENLIPTQLLRQTDFSAYFVSDGTVSNAVDDENGLIKNELIDGASDKINGFADDLMYLEREGKNNVGQ
ncbi:MAG: AAA family ATPase [Selenomonadaceae bacterium]|nr:AAA family ATPase [Selenomonadaceae bacterium]